jgi:predicted component of type VI protein secretion system
MINGECFIGRSPNCTIVCTSAEVSLHGSISFINGQYYFTDLASRSGSRINNEPAEINHQYPLKQDDILRIGDFILIVQKVGISPQKNPQQSASKCRKISRQF